MVSMYCDDDGRLLTCKGHASRRGLDGTSSMLMTHEEDFNGTSTYRWTTMPSTQHISRYVSTVSKPLVLLQKCVDGGQPWALSLQHPEV